MEGNGCCFREDEEKSQDFVLDKHLEKCGFSTRAIHAGYNASKNHNAMVPSITTSVNFKWTKVEDHGNEHTYSRTSNPVRNTMEECIASIELAKHAISFASGMGAETAIFSMLSTKDHLLCSMDVYGGTYRLLKDHVARNSFEVTFVDFYYYDNIVRAIKPNTKMIWMESPTNPLLKVFDIPKIAKFAHDRGNIIVVVDNTFLTPYFQMPLKLGADISMYSMTKYMNGHSDVVMGVAVVNSDDLAERLRFIQNTTGIVPSPFDCALVNRSLKTLGIRMERHKDNSLKLALFLKDHPKVLRVMHPGLKTHPQHELFMQQAKGHSGVFSFRHLGGRYESTVILSSCKIFSLAESLGGYESVLGFPTNMSHGSLDRITKEQLGICDSLIRVSVGLEDPEDLIADIDAALKKAFPAK